MSILLQNLEPTRERWGAATDEYPQGTFKNGSGSGQRDGSYCKAEWANDIFGFFGAILHAAGIKPNGKVETALNSQVFTALTQIITKNIQDEAVLVNVDQKLTEPQKEKVRETIGAGTSSLETASSEETLAGEDATKAVTPKALQTALDARFTAGTEDLEDGVSDLATGTVYFVYSDN